MCNRSTVLVLRLFCLFACLLLCVHKEVARNAPALHAGPLAFFYEKSLAKKLFICLGSSFFPLLLLLVRCSRLGSSMFCDRCVYRDFWRMAIVLTNQVQELLEIEQLANQKRTLRILANEWLVQWFQGFACLNLFARQVVPRRNPIVPHEMSVKIRRER